MAIQSPLGLQNISGGLVKTRKNVSASLTSANTIIKIIENRTKVSGEVFTRSSILRARRLEATRRQQMEDEIEVGKIDTTTSQGAAAAAGKSSGGFLSRILTAIGALGIGWLLNNLPTWIAMGTEFIARIRRAGEILGGFVSNIVSLIRGFGNVIGSLASNLSRFDLFDTSGQLQSSLDELNQTIENMGSQLEESFKLASTSLSEGLVSGQNAPPTGSEAPDTLYPDVDSGGGTSSGGGRWKPLLDVIASVESSTDKKNNGYDAQNGAPRGVRPGLSQMTIGEIARNAPGASGRYQQMPQFLLGRAKAAGFNENTVFSPQVQDVLAIKQIEGRGGNAWLSGKMSTETFMQGLSQEWAALPNAYGKFHYSNQKSSLRPEKVKSVLEQVKKGSDVPSTTINMSGMPAAFQPGQIQPGRRLRGGEKLTGSIGRGVSYIEITDAYGARGGTHKGIDIAAPSGTYIALRYDSEVVASGWYGDYGNLIDVWVPALGVQLRFAHLLQKPSVNGKIPAGISFARVGSTGRSSGPHIHFESDTKRGSSRYGGSGDPSPYVSALLLTKTPNQGSFTVPTISTTPPQIASPQTPSPQAQVSSTGQRPQAQMIASQSPERKGEQVYVVQTGTTLNQPAMVGGAPNQGTSQVTEFDLVNRFMKNKLLLDLAYL